MIKKIISLMIITAAITAGSSMGYAQEGIRVLPQVGINLTKLTDEPVEDADKFRTGFEAGLWLQTKTPVFFQPGLFYGQQGLRKVHISHLDPNNPNTSDTILNNVDYSFIKVPVMLGLQLLGARIYTGPTFTYVINVDHLEFTGEQFRDLNMGLNVGAGLNVSLFSFDLRYEYGISHVFREGNATSNTLTISAGLKF
ncbi:MAG: porin family protein [Bacteroidales bacterium]